MNIFEKIKFVNKVSKAIDEAKAVYERNDATVDKIKEIVERIIVCFEDLAQLLPSVGKLIDDIKKVFEK